MRVWRNSSSNESLNGFVFQEMMQTMEAVRISGLQGQTGIEKEDSKKFRFPFSPLPWSLHSDTEVESQSSTSLCWPSEPQFTWVHSLKPDGGGLVKSSLTLATPWTVARQAPLSMGFSRQEYWNGLPFPSPVDLPDLRIEPGSPALQADSLPTELPGKPPKPQCSHPNATSPSNPVQLLLHEPSQPRTTSEKTPFLDSQHACPLWVCGSSWPCCYVSIINSAQILYPFSDQSTKCYPFLNSSCLLQSLILRKHSMPFMRSHLPKILLGRLAICQVASHSSLWLNTIKDTEHLLLLVRPPPST